MTRTPRPARPHTTPPEPVLVSGAGIAGLSLAHWLRRLGHPVTVVEKAGAPRSGGYPVDVRGTALDVVERMGLLPRLREAHIGLRRLTFLDGDGTEVAALPPHSVTGGAEGRDLEVRRGDLTDALYEVVRDDVEFLFGDSIDSIDTPDPDRTGHGTGHRTGHGTGHRTGHGTGHRAGHGTGHRTGHGTGHRTGHGTGHRAGHGPGHRAGHGVDVTFRSGACRTFGLVVGADGTHSRTREILFGPEDRFHRHLGHCFAVFTMPNTLALADEVVLWNTPGRAAALYAVGDGDEVHALLAFAHPRPPRRLFGDSRAQRALLTEVFADAGWHVPDILAAARGADDLFFDAVGQIRMPRWSSGRVALLGDAAHAPSFLTGQGTSLALVGAYMLAASLAGRDHTAGFAAYEHGTRAFVTRNQDLVGEGGTTLFPPTAPALARRDARLRALRTLGSLPAPAPRPAHTSLTLPVFPAP
ncbi:FAD-dependent monooxygenase [Streptomyces sp. NPDC029526]|uniref:FAD-dependent monooxygenase n=1 Tax=Streptomyces sp. NPDC029526 TaxID=3155728 RepID=UPI0033C999F9